MTKFRNYFESKGIKFEKTKSNLNQTYFYGFGNVNISVCINTIGIYKYIVGVSYENGMLVEVKGVTQLEMFKMLDKILA